jgi:hypothetical protein
MACLRDNGRTRGCADFSLVSTPCISLHCLPAFPTDLRGLFSNPLHSQMTKVTARPPQTRVRSFGGCSTCRSRKVKCDESRPLCGQCSRAGLVCGYGAKIRFVHYTGHTDCTVSDGFAKDADNCSRRVLFSGIPALLPGFVFANVGDRVGLPEENVAANR